MIRYKDAGAVSRVTLKQAPELIRQRKAFSNQDATFKAFTDALGNYCVFSYHNPALRITPTGEVSRSEKNVYKTHIAVIDEALEAS